MENRTMVEEEITVGFDDEALTIKERLAGGKQQLQMISIIGMPGLGTSTLARKLYNDPYITHYFHIRAWTYASQLPRKTDVLLDILRFVNVDEIENMTNEKLGEKLYKQLKGKRYLIVIDDIWDIGAHNDLKMFFPDDNNKSRVMFTSRVKEASPDCHSHCLHFLTEEESWDCLPELIGIGKQIMKKCDGLPLAIVIIAGLLARNIKTQESWKQVVQSVSSYIVSDPNQYLDTLALSYNHLPRHLKPCFLYLGAFPEDQEIPGFIQKIGQRSLEEVAEDYLMDLIQRSLPGKLISYSELRMIKTLLFLLGYGDPYEIQVEVPWKPQRCDICKTFGHTTNLCPQKPKTLNPPSSKQEWRVKETNIQVPTKWEVVKKKGRDDGPGSTILFNHYSPAVVRSLLCTHKFANYVHIGDNSFDEFPFIFCTFKLLRVLDILCINAIFSRKLTQLVNLRYLAINLRGWYEVSPSISNLSNLETLIITSLEWRKVILPCNVWKIPKLRHLYAKG
ncbi:hypothetical protein HYC85_024013 [Camellia sinensis]|uniref:NB-ARC domain-containing protein n=1 Tax=Camellia sinensis TaxID=4442 RepID=A0A7J7GJW9_CAMSI|nr:hypothetical protein HYC85_024013 [Camellia sinensis]